MPYHIAFVLFNVTYSYVIFWFCRCRQWAINSGRADLNVRDVDSLHENFRLCALHFELSQFKNPSRSRLNWNAIPTIFNFSNPPTLPTNEKKLPQCYSVPAHDKVIHEKSLGSVEDVRTSEASFTAAEEDSKHNDCNDTLRQDYLTILSR